VLPTLEDIRLAAHRLRGVTHRTPVLRSRTLDALVGGELHLKAENLQRTGSFKLRGAYTSLASRPEPERRAGVLTTSSGNHAQAVALAARLLGTSAVVLMPTDAPAVKRAATEGYGARVVEFDRYADDRDELTTRLAAERGLPVLHAFDDDGVIAGQGTVALELVEEAGPLDALVVPTGGGGLVSGCAIVAKGLHPDCRVIAVEPEERPALREALAAGHPVKVPVPPTLADGQQTAAVGRRNLEAIARHVDEAVGVDDDALVDALRLAFERLKLVVEPSGAAALAAVLSGRVDVRGQRVGITLSGGNVDRARFARLID
jgi:threonine dehydratase